MARHLARLGRALGRISWDEVLWALALLLSLVAIVNPIRIVPTRTRAYLWVFDVSRSMTVVDSVDPYTKDGLVPRLEAARRWARLAWPHRPDGAYVGVAAFVGREIWVLGYPQHTQSQEDFEAALALVSADNAWTAGSFLATAMDFLAVGIRIGSSQEAPKADRLPTPLSVLVFTDGGTENPTLWHANQLLEGHAEVTLIGMGKDSPSPVPAPGYEPGPHAPCMVASDNSPDCFISARNTKSLETLAAALPYGRYLPEEVLLTSPMEVLWESRFAPSHQVALARPLGSTFAALALGTWLVWVLVSRGASVRRNKRSGPTTRSSKLT